MKITAMCRALKEAASESPNSHKHRTGKCPKGFVSDNNGRCTRASRLRKNKRSMSRHRNRSHHR